MSAVDEVSELGQKQARDREIWEKCASNYELRIVGGHPDVASFEEFEEDLLDQCLLHLCRTTTKPIVLIDLGCGSGRTLLRYAAQTERGDGLDRGLKNKLNAFRSQRRGYTLNHELTTRLISMMGIDFSEKMLNLAEQKINQAGLGQHLGKKIILKQGSVYDPLDVPDDVIPVCVCLVNSIGVMQGAEGAARLFSVIREITAKQKGVGLISAFMRSFVRSHALGQYESTLDVSGPPVWLDGNGYDLNEYDFIPTKYKLADDPSVEVEVSVFSKEGALVKESHQLKRIPDQVDHASQTGEIRTFRNYDSHWYSQWQFKKWIRDHWGKQGDHVRGFSLDRIRARPVQLAWCDPEDLWMPVVRKMTLG